MADEAKPALMWQPTTQSTDSCKAAASCGQIKSKRRTSHHARIITNEMIRLTAYDERITKKDKYTIMADEENERGRQGQG